MQQKFDWLLVSSTDYVSLCQSCAERFLCTLQSKVVKFMELSAIVHSVIYIFEIAIGFQMRYLAMVSNFG